MRLAALTHVNCREGSAFGVPSVFAQPGSDVTSNLECGMGSATARLRSAAASTECIDVDLMSTCTRLIRLKEHENGFP